MTATGARSAAAKAFATSLDTLIRARYPFVYLVSWEEARVDVMLAELARSATASSSSSGRRRRGLRRVGGAQGAYAVDNERKPLETLIAIGKLADPSLVVLKDFHPFLDDHLGRPRDARARSASSRTATRP